MDTQEVVNPPLNRHWLVWPTGATEWMLTFSEELAKKAKKHRWGCIEFVEVRHD